MPDAGWGRQATRPDRQSPDRTGDTGSKGSLLEPLIIIIVVVVIIVIIIIIIIIIMFEIIIAVINQ